jgi:hypothetical protein
VFKKEKRKADEFLGVVILRTKDHAHKSKRSAIKEFESYSS